MCELLSLFCAVEPAVEPPPQGRAVARHGELWSICVFVCATEDVWNSQNSSTAQGKLNEALALFKRSRAIDEKVYGPDHPEVATDLNNEAVLLKKMVRVVDASCVVVGAVESSPRGRAVETNGELLRICACC